MAIDDNYLYIDCKGSMEIYYIENNNLELIQTINKYFYTPAGLKIQGEHIYLTDMDNGNNYIRKYDISQHPIELVYEYVDEWDLYNDFVFDNEMNENFIIYGTMNHEGQVLDINNFDLVTEIETGGFYTVKDTLLFYEMINYELELSAVKIMDISDIYNPVEVFLLPVGSIDLFRFYYFSDSILYILGDQHIFIINLEDIYQPYVISVISDIPGIDDMNINTAIINHDNYLIFKNNYNKLWVYDITQLENPVYLNTSESFGQGATYTNCLVIYENRLFFSTYTLGIIELDLSALPDFEILNTYGETEFIGDNVFLPSCIVYSNNGKLYYFDIDSEHPVPQYLDNEQGITYSFGMCVSDSLLFIKKQNQDIRKIDIYQNIENQLEMVSTIPFDYSILNCNYIDPYLFVGNYQNGYYIYSVDQDYQLEQEGFIDAPETNSYLVEYNKNVNTEHLLIIKGNYGNKEIEVYQNEPPYNLVETIDLSQYNLGEYTHLYFLENSKILIRDLDYNYSCADFLLFDYTPPADLTLLDEMDSDAYYITLNEDFFSTQMSLGGNVNFYKWNNGQFTCIGNHTFDTSITDIYFDTDNEELYTVGNYNISKYSYSETGTDDISIESINQIKLTNFPNPFNNSTTISFSLNTENTENTEISIFNIKGQKVKTLECINHVDAEATRSLHSITWNGDDNSGKAVSSGIYFYKLETGDGKFTSTKKMILMK